jgi:N-acylneuraminate cytidylyltransferase
MRTVGLIPARCGSVRLPNKNTKLLLGKPLVQWTIEAARKSWLDDVYVSSNAIEVRELASLLGVNFIHRPDELCGEMSTSLEVIEHAIPRMSLGNHTDRIMLLQPTSPLRTASHIDDVLDIGRTSISVYQHGDYYLRNGAIYLMNRDALMEFETCYVMPEDISVDIDTLVDFQRAEKWMTEHGYPV